MPVGNVIVAGLYAGLCFFSRDTESRLRNLLFATVALSLFVNIGYFVSPSIMYGTVGCIFFLIVWFFSRGQQIGAVRLNKLAIGSVTCLFASSLLASVQAALFGRGIRIIPVTTRMDDVFFGVSSTVNPALNRSNVTMLVYLILFAFFSIAASEVISRGSNGNWTADKLVAAFHVFFILGAAEFAVNNFVQPFLIRRVIYNVMGVADPLKVYDGAARNGRFGFSLLFTEQSYIIVVLAYYALQLVRKDTSAKNVVWVVASIPVLYMNGSSTGVMLMPLGLLTVICLLSRRFAKRLSIISLVALALLISYVAYYLTTGHGVQLIESASIRIRALIYGGNYGTTYENSSSIRNMSNSIALKAWLSHPMVGLGLGTTRAYGLVTSSLVSLGIVGCLLYLGFIKGTYHIAELSIRELLVLLVMMAYLVVGLNINYLYSPALLAFILPFTHVTLGSSQEKRPEEKLVDARYASRENVGGELEAAL